MDGRSFSCETAGETAAGTLAWINSIAGFLRSYRWLTDAHLVNFFQDRLWEEMDQEWLDCLRDEPVESLLRIPFGFVKDNWPVSLQEFVATARSLALPRERKNWQTALAFNFQPLDSVLSQGMNMKKKHEVFPIHHLQIFTEDELDRMLCGEQEAWVSEAFLDHVKFDHGYTSSSLPVIHFLEIVREFKHEEQSAFLQFVTGAPRLPPGGLAALNPKLTVVRKNSGSNADWDLPSVMTCANYLKLPPYSTKERARERLLYAITEGQGSFHLS